MEDKLKEAFAKSLDIPIDKVVDDLTFNSIPAWDSIAHMGLIAELENSFDIMIETEDVLDMSSVLIAKEIIEKYGIKF